MIHFQKFLIKKLIPSFNRMLCMKPQKESLYPSSFGYNYILQFVVEAIHG